MPDVLTVDEALDWLALYEIDPWGQERADYRAAVQSVWNRGASFNDLHMLYPHVAGSDMEQLSEEDEAELIAVIERMNQGTATDATARAAESETDRIG